MITLRRAAERQHDRRRRQETWCTFYASDAADPLADGFGSLAILDEDRLPPGAGVAVRARHDAEIVTYVLEGALAYEDSLGRSGVIQGGEFQCITAGPRTRHRETNASRTDWAHVIQMWLRPVQAPLEPSHEQKRFSRAERRDGLRIIASPDARRGSLRVRQDTLIYSALLDPGQHEAHEVLRARSAWLHVVQGEVTVDGVVLTAGDGAGVTDERVVSMTAREESEILLLDVGERLPRSPSAPPEDRLR